MEAALPLDVEQWVSPELIPRSHQHISGAIDDDHGVEAPEDPQHVPSQLAIRPEDDVAVAVAVGMPAIEPSTELFRVRQDALKDQLARRVRRGDERRGPQLP